MSTLKTPYDGPHTSEEEALGAEYALGAVKSDRTICYVTSAGAYAGGPMHKLSSSHVSTDIPVIQVGNSGPLKLRYVKNVSGAPIVRGKVVEYTTAPFNIALADAAANGGVPRGVVLYDIPNNQYGWIVTEGVVEALKDNSTFAAGDSVTTAATGVFTDGGGAVGSGAAIAQAVDAEGVGTPGILITFLVSFP